MVRRRSTRLASSRILSLRDRRKLILRNRRNDISSSEARSSCGTLEKSIFSIRRSALAPETALPSPSGDDASPADSLLNVWECVFGWLLGILGSLASPAAGFVAWGEAFQNVSKSRRNRSHSSFDEVRAAHKAKANA